MSEPKSNVELKTGPPTEIVGKDLHPQAAELAEKFTLEYGTALLLQAKLLAHRRRDDMVLRSHVEDAAQALWLERRQKRWQIWVAVLGGVLFGTGTRGFMTELQGSRTPLVLGVYVALTIVGLLMVMSFQK